MAINLATTNLASLCNKKIQQCATNYILLLSEFTSDYRLNQAKSISTYQHEVTDMYPILFQVFKNPTTQALTSTTYKLMHTMFLNDSKRHKYFNRILSSTVASYSHYQNDVKLCLIISSPLSILTTDVLFVHNANQLLIL